MILNLHKIVVVALWLFIGCLSNSYAYTNPLATEKSKGWAQKPFQRKAFIENKGQFNHLLPADKTNFEYVFDNGASVFFYKNELLFYVSKPLLTKEEMEHEEEDKEKEEEREEKMRNSEKQFISMKWLNANPNAQVEVSEEQTVDYGYVISSKTEKGHTKHCKGYSKLKIKNLYNGVDIEYFFNENEGYKYNLYVAPNTDLTQIQQVYDGAADVKLMNGNIVIKTIKGDIIDHAPVSYLTANTAQKITSDFQLKNTQVSFAIQNTTNAAITIDPWVTVPAMTGSAVDNGVDKYGNTYITSSSYILEKYSPTGTLLLSTNVMGGVATIYGDMLTDSRGYCFFNTVGFHSRGDATGVDSAGNFLWDSFGISECWRFVLNECTNQVLSLTGYRHSETGFARINTETGALTGYTQSGNCCQDPHCGAIDYNGDVYCVVSGDGDTKIYHWTPANTIATTYPAIGTWGYGTGYVGDGGFAQGYNGMTILGNNLYIYDGATLYKVNKTSGATVSQVTVPGGVNAQNGGIYITSCGTIFVGSSTGVYMYDINFNQLDFKSTTGKVFDLAFNTVNQTIVACGTGHVTELAFTINPCVFQTNQFVQPSCAGGSGTGYIKLNLTGGVPNYGYTWTYNGTPLPQTTDSIGGLLPGTYKCVYVDNLCPIPNKDSIEIVVPSAVAVTANFTAANACLSAPIEFADGSSVSSGSITAWDWTFDDTDTSIVQSPSHTYTDDGTYNVKLVVTSSDGCKDSITKPVIVYPKPEADFTHINQCDGTAVPFTNASTVAPPEVINSWNWSFGDNTSGTGSTTTHLYASPATYTVTLIVNTTNMCSDTVSYPVIVYNSPVASFTTANVCFDADSVYFNNTSTIAAPDAISTYLWNFDDGATAPTANATHLYNSYGNYNVTLVVSTANNCTDAAATTVSVFDAPVSIFSVASVCLIDEATFSNTSTAPTMGTTASFTWDFGDGSAPVNNVSNPQHSYTSIGNYAVTLITRSSNLACADTLVDSISVYPMPVADFATTDVCLNEAMIFADSSTVVSGTIDAWSWNFGDSSPLNTNQDPSHTYLSYNTFTVTQIVTSNNGCKDTVSKTVMVHPLPTAMFNLISVCDGNPMEFTDASSIPDGTIQTWTWNFGDNTALGSNQNPTHIYATEGAYPVQLLVTSTFGCVDSIVFPGVVNPRPDVDFTSADTIGCEPLCINFDNLSNISLGNISSYAWQLGPNNATASNQNPSYCYVNDSTYAPLSYDVTLTVTSNAGCVTTLTKTNYITVYPLPVAQFTATPVPASILDPIITITDASVGADMWTWTFGENEDSISFLPNPAPYTYADTGTYLITLITSTQYNCADTTYQTVVIEPNFLFYIPSAFSPNGDGVNETFTGKGIYIDEFEMSIFNRWGDLIYITKDIDKPWDGTANGGSEAAQQDVYIYVVTIKDYLNKKHDYKGTVTLVR